MAQKIQFEELCKHDIHQFAEGAVVEFEDSKAAAYFIALGAAKPAAGNSTPDMVMGVGDLHIDPNTVWGSGSNRGKKVV